MVLGLTPSAVNVGLEDMGSYSQYAEPSPATGGGYVQYSKLVEEPVKDKQGLMSKPKADWEDVSYGLVSDKIGVDKSLWNTYREELAKIESAGDYSAKGGKNNHYDGRYQLGKAAKIDAASLLGTPLKHDTRSRVSFRSDIDLQEKALAAYTAKNHSYMMRSPLYKKLSKKEKLAALAYAHNQGHGGAKAWLKTGVVGTDAFGTKGTKFSNALKDALQ